MYNRENLRKGGAEMLFRKRIPRSCQYCVHSAELDEERLLCTKRGIVSVDHQCRKFRYAPCKRIPPKPKAPDFSDYTKEDFSL